VGVGVGVGVEPGTGSVVGTPLTMTGTGVGMVPEIFAGGGKSRTGWPFNAPCIYAVQMRAGNEPPVTELSPPMPWRVSVASLR